MAQMIANLEIDTAVKSLNVTITNPEAIPVSLKSDDEKNIIKTELTSVSSDVQNNLKAALQLIIASAFADEMVDPITGQTKSSLSDQLKSALEGLNVHINNDFFDDMLTRDAFKGGN